MNKETIKKYLPAFIDWLEGNRVYYKRLNHSDDRWYITDSKEIWKYTPDEILITTQKENSKNDSNNQRENL